MLEELGSKPKISEFMHLYPKSQWKDCLTFIAIIGISALENSFQRFLPVEELGYLAETTPLPLNFQVPDLKNTLVNMKDTIDRINTSLEKENEDFKRTSKKISSKSTQKIQRTTPSQILMESTPRFKVLDDMFNKQKWKKEASLNTIREEINKSPTAYQSSSKPKPLHKPLLGDKKNLVKGFESRLKDSKADARLADGNYTERPYAPSPTLEELLSNSRFTVREDPKLLKNEDFSGISESKQSFENSIVRKEQNSKSFYNDQKRFSVSIAEEFLKNPLISQLAPKKPENKQPKNFRDTIDEDTASKISIRSYSPINSLMLLEKDDL